jgi:hypothetical protein
MNPGQQRIGLATKTIEYHLTEEEKGDAANNEAVDEGPDRIIPKKAKTRLATAIKSPLRAIALVLMLGLADELYPVLRCTESATM